MYTSGDNFINENIVCHPYLWSMQFLMFMNTIKRPKKKMTDSFEHHISLIISLEIAQMFLSKIVY
jgi:hypothetical protein